MPHTLHVPVTYGYILHYTVKAWTGGEPPTPGNLTTGYRNIFESLRCQLYREQWGVHVAAWQEAPDADTRHLFWGRATYDAWRTMFPTGR